MIQQMDEAMNYDVVIVGAGIVGMTVAYEILQKNATLKIAILEKENRTGAHASGRNSGVMHCGIYYAQDSLKAQVCAKGAQRMLEFAREHAISFEKSGKVLLATSEEQLPVVERLMKNAKANGIQAQLVNAAELKALEPYAAQGVATIYCPDTAVIDSGQVLVKLQQILEKKGVHFLFDHQVFALNFPQQIQTNKGMVNFGFLFNCAGAYADTVAKMFGLAQEYALIPFKGIYWKLNPEANAMVRANIYPVPDVSLPFLGIHFTRVINGEVYVGPTAIPVLGRENYHRLQGIRMQETWQIMLRLSSMYLRNENNFRLLAKTELSKYYKPSFYQAAKKLLPQLERKHLIPTTKAGIRPQLINMNTHQLEMDYILSKTKSSMHVLNAISPAFTSSFAFAELIVNQSGLT